MTKSPTQQFTLIKARVTTKASSERITLERQPDGSCLMRIYVTPAPENSKANKAVISLVAKHFKIKKSHISLIHGLKSREKVIQITTAITI